MKTLSRLLLFCVLLIPGIIHLTHSSPEGGTGFVSITLGAGGLMKTWFWPSVFLLYLGLGVFAFDLLFAEKIHWKMKFLFVSVIAVLAMFIAKGVVLHPSPISFSYATSGNRLQLNIHNDSMEDDYTNVDVQVALPGEIFFGSVTQITPGPSCSMVSNPNTLNSQESEVAIGFPHQFRFTCNLPHQTSAEYVASLVHFQGDIHSPPTPAAISSAPRFKASFDGKFRMVRIDGLFTK